MVVVVATTAALEDVDEGMALTTTVTVIGTTISIEVSICRRHQMMALAAASRAKIASST